MPAVRKHLLAVPIEQVCLSVLTQAELLFGVLRKPDNLALKTAVNEFLLRLTILPWDEDSAYHYASLRAVLERQGNPMGNMDIMIAAHALANRITLVSNDVAFRKVKGLNLANWAIP